MSSKKIQDDDGSLSESVFGARPSSSEVIKDAKRWCVMKSIQTKRPITPRDTSRVLYGPTPTRGSRPPSSYSLGPQSYDPSDDVSRPGSVTPLIKSKLAPLPHTPTIPVGCEPTILSTNSQKASSVKSSVEPTSFTKENSDVARPKVVQDRHSGEGKTEETCDEALHWNKYVLPILEEIEGHLANEITLESIIKMCQACKILFTALEKGSCFDQMSSRRRKSLLSIMFRLLNIQSRELHILCAKIILQLKIKNKNLTNLCMLLFAICRDGKHDSLFVEHNIITPMLVSMNYADEVLTNYEKYKAFVYLTGSLKCLSENEFVAQKLFNISCMQVLTDFMITVLNSLKEIGEDKRAWKYAESLIVQVCSAYCNMLNVDEKLEQSLQSLPTLMIILKSFYNDIEIVTVLFRIFSKMTMYTFSFPVFFSQEFWPQLFLSALSTYYKHSDTCIHLSLVLGDLTSQTNHARNQLYNDKSLKCMDILIKIMRYYLELDDQLSEEEIKDKKFNDVLIKVVRIIAHLSISEVIGPKIAADKPCIDIFFMMLDKYDVNVQEELVINILATLNNLSYYSNDNSIVCQNRLRVAVLLSDLLLVDRMTCVSEVLRVFGNITKFDDVRDLLHKHKVSHMMVALLDSGDRLVVYNACGVLVNMSADHEKRADIIAEGSVLKCLELIQDFASIEWRIGGVACQLFWNLSSDPTFVPPDTLIEILEDLLIYSSVNKKMKMVAQDQESLHYLQITWKKEFYEFAFPRVIFY